MRRRLIQSILGRFGKSLLIFVIVVFVWAAWWIWPERPLREIRILRSDPTEVATLSGNGKYLLLSSITKSRVLRMSDLQEILSDDRIQRNYVLFESTGREIYLLQTLTQGNEMRIYNPDSNIMIHVHTRDYKQQILDDMVFKERVLEFRVQNRSDTHSSKVNRWIYQLLSRITGLNYVWIRTSPSNQGFRRVPSNHFVGFTDYQHVWTQNKDTEYTLLQEWSVHDVKTPKLLWTFTALAVLLMLMVTYPRS